MKNKLKPSNLLLLCHGKYIIATNTLDTIHPVLRSQMSLIMHSEVYLHN